MTDDDIKEELNKIIKCVNQHAESIKEIQKVIDLKLSTTFKIVVEGE